MRCRHLTFPFALLATAALVGPAVAGGLRCSIGEVVVDNLKIGQTYSLNTLANLPLSITNTGDQEVHVAIDALVPGESELKNGAEALPSTSWASASPDTLRLEPGETKTAEMVLEIPDDEALFGRKFQVMFWSHTLPVPGRLLAVGLKSRVIFTIDTSREDPGVVPTGALGIEFATKDVRFDRVKPGKTYRLEDATKQPLEIKNVSDRTLEVELEVLPADAFGAVLDPGYAELLDSGHLELSDTKLVLEPGEAKTIEGMVSLAKRARRDETTFTCVIAAAVTNLPVKTRILSRVFAHPG